MKFGSSSRFERRFTFYLRHPMLFAPKNAIHLIYLEIFRRTFKPSLLDIVLIQWNKKPDFILRVNLFAVFITFHRTKCARGKRKTFMAFSLFGYFFSSFSYYYCALELVHFTFGRCFKNQIRIQNSAIEIETKQNLWEFLYKMFVFFLAYNVWACACEVWNWRRKMEGMDIEGSGTREGEGGGATKRIIWWQRFT